MTTFVKTLGIRGQEYIVVKDEEGYYLSINKEYIDENGCLTQELNGLQMHASKDLNDCVNSTIADVEIEYLENIKYYCLVMSEEYIKNHFDDIKRYANVIENRLDDKDFTIKSAIDDNTNVLEFAKKHKVNYILINDEYKIDIDL